MSHELRKKETTMSWNDYPDDDSSSNASDSDDDAKPKANNQAQPEANDYTIDMVRGDMIWLQAVITSPDPRDHKESVFDLKKRDEKIKVFFTEKEINSRLDVLIFKDIAQNLLERGLNGIKEIKFIIHKRNFENSNGERRDRGDRGERGGRGGGRGGDRRGRDGGGRGGRGGRRDGDDRRKPKYVDKETGKESDNKKKLQERLAEEKERHYTKRQANQIGEGLANFRNKPLEERRKEMDLKQKDEPKPEPKYKRDEPPKFKETWKRKDLNEEGGKDSEVKETKEEEKATHNGSSQQQPHEQAREKKSHYKEREQGTRNRWERKDQTRKESADVEVTKDHENGVEESKDEGRKKGGYKAKEGNYESKPRAFEEKTKKKYKEKVGEDGKPIEQPKRPKKIDVNDYSRMMSDDSDGEK